MWVPRIIPIGQTLAAVAHLPLAGLRLPQALIELLESLGLRTIGQVAALPREGLTARFGPQLLTRLDELTGAKSETIDAHRPPPQFEAEFQFPYPTTRAEAIDDVILRLSRQLARELLERRQGALGLLCRLWLDDGRMRHLSVGLYRPTARARHMAELVQMQWQQQQLPEPVATIRLTVAASGPLEAEQRELFAEDDPEEPRGSSPRDERRLAMLWDRLGSRMGRDAVLQVRLIRDAVPEQACRVEPLTSRRSMGFPARTDVRHGLEAHATIRPLWLLPRPQPIAVVAVAPDGPPARLCLDGLDEPIVEALGPERIETGWWRGPSVRRDYYRVATASGARFWLFRRRGDGRWFLHGEFE